MLRLSGEVGVSLEAAQRLDVYAAGCESNVAVGLARLGVVAGWLSALPDNPLGRLVAGQLRRAGVDVSPVLWVPNSRIGLYFTEMASGEWIRDVVYDRADSALATCDPDELDWTHVQDARLLHLSGITPALVPNGRSLFERARKEARRRGIGVSLDVNLRRSLWSESAASEYLRPHLDDLEVLFVSQRDLAVVADVADPEAAARSLGERHGVASVVVTMGEKGALAWHEGAVSRTSAQRVEVVDRIGRGDAFVAGWLSSWLRGGDAAEALRVGCAAAAVAQTYKGDLLWGDAALFERVLRGEGIARER
jgi:2-dehydro-3-deoxygluconokinase